MHSCRIYQFSTRLEIPSQRAFTDPSLGFSNPGVWGIITRLYWTLIFQGLQPPSAHPVMTPLVYIFQSFCDIILERCSFRNYYKSSHYQVQGISHWTVLYELALKDRNMQVKSCLKVVLECWDDKFLIYILGFQKSNIGWPQQPLTERV